MVNPKTEGTINNVYRGKTPLEAANGMWNSLSEHMVNTVPHFMFTLQNIANGNNEHFKVSENSETGEYNIVHLHDIKVDNKKIEKFNENVNEYTKSMKGGNGKRRRYKKYGDSDESSSSDSSKSDDSSDLSDSSDSDEEINIFPKIKSDVPISMMYYNPTVYYSVDPKYNSLVIDIVPKQPIYLPSFNSDYKTHISLWPFY